MLVLNEKLFPDLMLKIKKAGGWIQRGSDSGSNDSGCDGGNLAAARITSWPTDGNPPHTESLSLLFKGWKLTII